MNFVCDSPTVTCKSVSVLACITPQDQRKSVELFRFGKRGDCQPSQGHSTSVLNNEIFTSLCVESAGHRKHTALPKVRIVQKVFPVAFLTLVIQPNSCSVHLWVIPLVGFTLRVQDYSCSAAHRGLFRRRVIA